MTTKAELEALFAAHGFTMHCDCPDEAEPYEPCECCGTRVGFSHGRCVEDNLVRGCSTAGGGHCRSWTPHTAKRCREMRAQLPPIEWPL
ncbi:hypothetical protein I4I73_03360 [Pseudonocardia sp. KRD-184]|uniref:TNFR-Cys domain-containing protein n=1 Tax=Pseudonocardia oceani TaxID=2792013 RepID=A0ABS6UG30_9PSEU|nr:hypothetical protein [Pseudonocardia oceani]MBW0088253.1 hypothetical protein [Pseudonocardia oceani]MBW0095035.1 hypothetical protein [Pseudonocardia oceani]MBW0121112.1 hypothetical protein [Pseudonocardia oceani]MBW0131202.1 hypothetical protein [Pseudonocardia oceani]MBW0132631.1 hypothetical protein [Pseudonocardia oceani]